MEKNIEQTLKKVHLLRRPWMQSIIAFVFIFGALATFLFWQTKRGTVFIENSYLDAPIINLSPTLPGTLNALYVKEGDRVQANTQVTLVGSQVIYTQEAGIVSSASPILGSYFSPGDTIVSIVNDQEMKVVGQIEETKGLSSLKTGQRAVFTVDAFPGKNYEGVLDEISPVSSDNGVVFSISDKRPVKKFDIKVRFNVANYPELKSGMSAKITVYEGGI